MNDIPTFGEWLKHRRKELGFTLKDLARFTGYSAVMIRKVEASERRPSRPLAEALTEPLGVPLDEREAFVHFALASERGQLSEPSSTPREIDWRSPWSSQPKMPTGTPNNLPAQRTSFVGRAEELGAAMSLLRRAEVRILTLTGPPGVGKTRTAIQLASQLLDNFEDGVFFVPLAAVRDPERVASTIAQVLDVRETANTSIEATLKEYLSRRKMLLVLDNFEHLLAAAVVVADLLAAAPDLKVVVTSREIIRIYGEYNLPIPPMHTPSTELEFVELMDLEAVQLFTQRATAAKLDFALTGENARAVAEICRQLDGLPLAIELAATWVKSLSPEVILVKLGSRLDLLVKGPLDLPERQQALRNAIGWSYDLLEEQHRVVFRRLATFVGRFTAEAAEEVVSRGELQAPQGRMSTFNLLLSLLDKSLLRQTGEGQYQRFAMLETIREYAWERLQDSGELEAAARNHALYYLKMAEDAEDGMRGAEQAVWLNRLEEEYDNLRAVLRWARERENQEVALRMSAALHQFWMVRGYLSEGENQLNSALSIIPSRQVEGMEDHLAALKAKAMDRAGVMAYLRSKHDLARSLLEESLSIRRALGDKRGTAQSLHSLALVAQIQGDASYARSLMEEALNLDRQIGDLWGVSQSLGGLAYLAEERGDYASARSLYEESLSISRQLKDDRSLAMSLNQLGCIVRYEGDYARARSLYEQSFAIARELGDKPGIATLLNNLGHVAREEKNYPQAIAFYKECLKTCQEIGEDEGNALFMEGMASVAHSQGKMERAARLWGAAATLRSALDLSMMPTDQMEHETQVELARSKLDPHTWERAWSEGMAMRVEQAIAYALEDVEGEGLQLG